MIKITDLSLVNQAYRELKRIILEHRVSLGGKLNEGEIATALGISRTPVREAVNRLEKEGLVEIFPQRRDFVVQFSERDIFELFLIRENLEEAISHLKGCSVRVVEGMDANGDKIAFVHPKDVHGVLVELRTGKRQIRGT